MDGGRGSAPERHILLSPQPLLLYGPPILPQEALSLAVAHFWPLDSGNPGFYQGVRSSWPCARGTDVMTEASWELGPQHGAGKTPWQPGIGGQTLLE